MAKKISAGERIAAWTCGTTVAYGREIAEDHHQPLLAQRIDRAISRAVKAERAKINGLASTTSSGEKYEPRRKVLKVKGKRRK